MATQDHNSIAPMAHPTRRSLLIAAPAVAALAAIPAAALANDPDAAIKAAWQRRQVAYAEYNSLPPDQPGLEEGECETPDEKRCWVIIDEAEEVIRSTKAKTVAGVTIQLWCALYHSVGLGIEDAAITRGDFDWLAANDERLDWSARLALAAMRSLRSMGA